MFEKNPADMTRTLGEMFHAAYNRSNCNQNAAKEKFKEYVRQDKRFSDFDRDRLADRVMECRSNGARLDLDDPYLHGGERRPLSR